MTPKTPLFLEVSTHVCARGGAKVLRGRLIGNYGPMDKFLPLHSLWWEKEMKIKGLLIPDATVNILFILMNTPNYSAVLSKTFCRNHNFCGGRGASFATMIREWFECHFRWVLSSKWISPIIFWALTVGSTTFTGDVTPKSFEKPQEQSHAECVSEGLGCYGRTWWKLVSQRLVEI